MSEAAVQKTVFDYRRWTLVVVLGGLCWAAYLPALNNGFISDDYVMLDWLDQWRNDFSFLFRIVPDVFRITTYVAFASLRFLFGLQPGFFYAFAILVHFANAVLLWRMLAVATGDRAQAALAAVLFAAFQNPQEAIMWLAAMGDALAGMCILAAVLLWLKGRFLWAVPFYVAGLFSKESALVLPLLLPLVEFAAGRKPDFRRQCLYLWIPTALFCAFYVFRLSANYLVTNGSYAAPGMHALVVLGISLHRLMFPWLYLALLLPVIARRPVLWTRIRGGLAWMAVGLLPYIFLTYQNHVPSRHEYIASAGLAWALAAALQTVDFRRLRPLFVTAFIGINIAYLWYRKDFQFEERAAPTNRLIEALPRYPPGPLIITNFPLNPWMAKRAARMAAGWERETIRVNESPDGAGADRLELRWDPSLQNYVSDRQASPGS